MFYYYGLIEELPPPAGPAIVPTNAPALENIIATWADQPPQVQISKKLPPSIMAVSVSNPPFAHSARTVQLSAETAAIAQPDPWSYVFGQATQPYGRDGLPPAKLAVPVNNPPIQATIVEQAPVNAWWVASDPIQSIRRGIPQGAPASFLGSLNNLIQAAALAWPIIAPMPVLAAHLNPALLNVAVNNPPITSNALEQLAVGGAWPNSDQPLSIVKGKLNPALLAVRVDTPPVSSNALEQLAAGGLWPLVDQPLPITAGKLNPAIINVPANNPPVATNALEQLAAGGIWPLADQPLPILAGKINPANLNVPVNNPPVQPSYLEQTPAYSWWLAPDPLPIRAKALPQGAVVISAFVPAPPNWLSTILGAWVLPSPQPPVGKRLPATLSNVPIANPPFGLPAPSLSTVLGSWVPGPPQPIVGALRIPPTVNNPPFGIPSPSSARIILDAWTPPPPQAPVTGKLNSALLNVRVDNPPIAVFAPWLQVILPSWIPGPPQPTLTVLNSSRGVPLNVNPELLLSYPDSVRSVKFPANCRALIYPDQTRYLKG